ncbi:hypothetical protein POM88_029794 [Heracleum sosnowskyi]|uniref:Cysteine-rich receptor-like protein kinase 25 n=1 Tax=Heracleum sosnowskyi TaxID=360622 RepID=A0AAD8HVQ2_9APIA|nr:hypothetical protein POM88_029794 [Heracleum sosnowskyi]
MGSCNKKVAQFMLCCCLVIIVPCSASAPEYMYHICRNRTDNQFNSLTTYKSNSLFEANNSFFQDNRKVLLSKLASNAAENHGYYNCNTGQNFTEHSASKLQLTSRSTLYGFSLCQGDLLPKDCEECVTTATEDIQSKCPIQTFGVIWYAECMVRYDSKLISTSFSEEDEGSVAYLWNTQNVTDEDQFQRVLGNSLDTITIRASEGIPLNSQTTKSFALTTANLSSQETLYALAQCRPDLPEAACSRCLRVAINFFQYHNNSIGGRIFIPSCTVRYEMYPFYRNIAIEPSPPDVINQLPPTTVAAPISLPRPTGNGGVSSKVIVAIVAPVFASLLIFLVYWNVVRKAKIKGASPQQESGDDEITTIESLQFELDIIKAATNDFSPDNKIGAGGFGDVFKGVLANGDEIAVKRLSKSSCQGSREFQNEVVLVAKLQHKNLVRLLGFCLQEDEKILVYEYIPNKSLDNILFDPERQRQLDWPSRCKIILGIARGILGGEQTQGSTNRVVGTFGYMSPEYVMHGKFSSKSDIFSFGVLVLEIISGKKNSSFYQSDRGAEDLLSYTWKQWKHGTPLEVMDPSLIDSYSSDEVLRCIQIGLLCVQEAVDARPFVAWVLMMLDSQSVSIALPKRPPYFCSSTSESQALEVLISDQRTNNSKTRYVDDSSITEVYAR